MKHLLFLLCLIFLLGIASQVEAEVNLPHVRFTDSYLSGREISEKSGKPLLVYFYNNEKQACRKINELWKDPEVATILSDKFICARVNIRYFDGEVLKKYHKIEEAPAIIILAPDGKTKRRINTALNKAGLMAFITGEASSITYNHPSTDKVENASESSRTDTEETVQKNKPAQVKEKPIQVHNSGVFTIQTGVFSTMENAEQKVKQLERYFNEPIHTLIDNSSSRKLYRVVIGEFNNKQDAEHYLQLIKRYNIKGFVKTVHL